MMKSRLIVLLALVISAVASIAQAKNGFMFTIDYYRNHSIPLRSDGAAVAAKTTLNYYGGAVLSNPKVCTVYWGWANPEVEQNISDFYAHFANSNMMEFLDQYNTNRSSVDGKPGTNQHIGRGVFGGTFRIKPRIQRGAVTDTQIQAEIQRQIDKGVLPQPDGNTLYMIHFPKDMLIDAFGVVSCRQFCAYHFMHGDPKGYHWSYGVMPDLTTPGCSMGCAYGTDNLSSTTVVSSHEFVEATTDPTPTLADLPGWPSAWNTSDGDEIGDICAGGNNSMRTGNGGYMVQSEFDNATHSCTNRDWKSF